MLFPSVLCHLPRRRCAGCWICRSTADSCRRCRRSVWAGPVRRRRDRAGAHRPDGRRRPGAALCAEGLSSRRQARRRSRRGQFITGARPVVRRGARRRGAGAAPGAPVGAWPARRSSPGQVPGCRGRQAADGTAGLTAGSAHRNGPGCGRLAGGRPYALPGRRYRMRNPLLITESNHKSCALSPRLRQIEYELAGVRPVVEVAAPRSASSGHPLAAG